MLAAILLLSLCPAPAPATHVRVGYTTRYPGYAEAGISLALDNARANGLLAEHNITIIVRPAPCTAREAFSVHMGLIETDRVDVILGHQCSSVCIATGYLDSLYNVARFPMVCADPDLADKATYPSLVRMMPSMDKLGRAFRQLFGLYGWRRAAFMTTTWSLCEFGMRSIRDTLLDMNVTIAETVPMETWPVTDEVVREGLLRMKAKARVLIVCNYWSALRTIMYTADELGMTTPEYTFLYYELMPMASNVRPWVNTRLNETTEQIAQHKRSFASLKQVTMASLNEDAYSDFHVALAARYAQDPWNKQLEYFYPYSIFLADAAYLYFRILHQLLEEGADFRNGRHIFQRAKNTTFQGWTGRVKMDDNADREPDFWVWDCPPDVPKCRPYAYITIGDQAGMDEFAEPYWATENGEPPADTPVCGFQGEHCQDKGLVVIVVPTTLSVVLLLLVVVVYIRRQQLRERELHMMTWRVNYSDIDFSRSLTGQGSVSMRSMNSVAKSMRSVGSSHKSGAEQVFAKVGSHNGILVAVAHIQKPSINRSRELLVELRQMKEMVHENINPFLGACIDAPNICLLSAYCSKGSLQDILEDDDIKLDWMFKSSLLRDLINGMCYIRGTPLKTHGSLRSSNCLIDSRWVLKLSGFGFARFREGAQRGDASESKLWARLLWTAPELLRLNDMDRPVHGTEKADVYSFAIILQETVYRAMPFFECMEPAAIVEKVKQSGEVPFRPTPVSGSDVIKPEVVALMERCWQEDPAARPTFADVRKTFRSFNRGEQKNILDTMVLLLEKYAGNLEGLVAQRTEQLVEEKKKTDLLLHRMLPSSVADLLKVGRVVDPEMYENVTIYFSDIVGFTSLSSSSTPMEVVDLLNDLYTAFDRTIEKYDVYKVETIGDAYMVVSGLPVRNGSSHAPEIADMGLALLDQVLTFRIRHRPDTRLNLRIGLHSGPCAAGVVGQTMPRYCLFGDTVNMASRMESTGEAQRIHISESTRTVLSDLSQYDCVLRGTTDVKGKGSLTTYWLKRKEQTLLTE